MKDRFGNLVLISMDFDDFSPFTPKFLFRLRRYIKHSRLCFIGYPNILNFVKKYSAACHIFNCLLVGWIPMKHCLMFDILLDLFFFFYQDFCLLVSVTLKLYSEDIYLTDLKRCLNSSFA